jgi:hypothetical protein
MMNTRLRQFLLGFALLITIAACFLFKALTKMESRQLPPAPVVRLPSVPPEQPVYQGKPLSYWVIKVGQIEEYNGAPDDAMEAIRVIGPKAVPFLLHWMPRPETLRHDRSGGTPGWDAVEIAWWALGSDGKSAIPVLARIINQPQRTMDDYSVWTESAKAISYLGPDAIAPMLTAVTNMQGKHEVWELIHNFQNLGTNGAPAVPALIHWANDPDYWVRDGVVSALGGIGQRPDLAVPVLLNALEHDSNGMVRRDAAEALGAFANDSDAVLPELTKMLKDPDWQARGGALSGLGKIRAKPDVVIPLIVPFLSDENSVIERSAAYALRDLNCRTAYNALVENSNPNIGDIVYQAGEQEKARKKHLK